MNKTLIGRRNYIFLLPAFCLFAGIAAGTVWINGMGAGLREQLGAYGQVRLGGGPVKPQLSRLFQILLQRELAGGLIWLTGMTVFAVPGICVSAIVAGFFTSSVLALLTVQNGIAGLPIYLLSILPQVLFYVPAAAALFLWSVEPEKKTHLGGYLILVLLIAFGVLSECFLNPYCMRLAEIFF